MSNETLFFASLNDINLDNNPQIFLNDNMLEATAAADKDEVIDVSALCLAAIERLEKKINDRNASVHANDAKNLKRSPKPKP
jgi:hypothetical protein